MAKSERSTGTRNERNEKILAWGLLVVALLLSAASSIFGLYNLVWWFDEALHGYFSFALALVLALYAYNTILTGRRRHEVLLVLAVASLGLSAGVLWEWTEWVYDLIRSGNQIQGKTDTLIDLLADAIGGLMAGALSLPMLRSRE